MEQQQAATKMWVVRFSGFTVCVRVNGLTEICLTKVDVLDELKQLRYVQDMKLEMALFMNFHWT